MEKKNHQKLKLKKMIFIWNALENGWNVKKIDKDIYQFKLKNSSDSKNIDLSGSLLDFVNCNSDISYFIHNNV